MSKLGVEAPKSLPILRQAIYERVNDIETDREPENIADL
ncbi:MAG: carbon storage regulator [Oscillospiraceae bacterium]|nr:carbon storage regulator [Oscillospiraceae bacterium]